ncbi:hypothetical protein [Curtobacterium aurantiacum]|uniref:Uncharacterized protein n=1 Tax=Curtobacterium aurantiacum TaxID=3236919 RepID=A0ABS5VLI6_9MICO|nr:hypothetical protein [Curtobacterium flaccumfaciens]MBT1546422.1 hypothetical protein [Curtobacterium flaccumfaciens pv. flaccumfaciens]MBT1588902.1 hypothetical protein [Curtobacterium flaccumfaciens pv. flaccumfaciens]
MSGEQGASFRVDELREGRGSSPSDEVERAFRTAEAATDKERIASMDGWLGRSQRKQNVNLPSVDVELAKATVKLRARDLDVRLKRFLAFFAVIAVSVQLSVADVYFVRLIVVGQAPSDTVLVAWLSSTVVEVIGIVAIVARNLFPDRTRRPAVKRKRS